MNKEKYTQEINKTTINCWSIISIVLVICYIIEVFKGLRTPEYVLVFSIFTLLPLLITMFFNKKWEGKSENIKYFATIGYMIFYTFSLLSTQSKVSFVYIIPMISVLIIYCDTKVISILYIYSIILNLFTVIHSITLGHNTQEDMTYYEIQIACLVLSYLFLIFAMKMVKKSKNIAFELSSLIIIDELTGAYNRKFISQNIIPNFEKYLDNGISLAFLDIDHFGDFNNTYGHECGDIVLKELSKIVKSDIEQNKNTYFIRNGGDEFLLISFSMSYKNFTKICEDIRSKIEQDKIKFKNENLKITLSIGCANSKIEHYDDFFDLKDKADERLYLSKNNGRNKITI